MSTQTSVEKIMKKLAILLGVMAVVGATSAAEARTNISVGFGVPAPVYYEPAPVYYRPVYSPPVYYGPSYIYYNTGWERHRNYNWGYWHDRGYYDRDYDRGWHR